MTTTRRPTRKAELLQWATERCLLEHLDRPETLTLAALHQEISDALLRLDIDLEYEAAATGRQRRPDAVRAALEGDSPWV